MSKFKAILVAASLATGLVAAPAAAGPIYKAHAPTTVVKTVKVDPYGGVIIEKDLVTDVKFKRGFRNRGFRSRGFRGRGFNQRGFHHGRRFNHGSSFKKKSFHHGGFKKKRVTRKRIIY